MRAIGRLALHAALLTGALSPAMAADAASKLPVVGRLNPGSARDPSQMANLAAFRDGMRALGHAEGRTYSLETRFADGDIGRLPALAAELVRRQPAVILAGGGAAVRAVRAATGAIPIVMATVAGDPVRMGFVASLARPGGNVTGVAGLLEEVSAKQLELLRKIVPRLSKVAVLYNMSVMERNRLQAIIGTAGTLGLTVHVAGVASTGDIAPAFEAIGAARAEAVLVMPEPAVIARERRLIAALALRHRLPSVFTFRTFTEAGGLLSYSQNLVDLHRYAAEYVDKILKGAKPADLPVEQPTKFELVVNLKTAEALGITIPQPILLRADEVIE